MSRPRLRRALRVAVLVMVSAFLAIQLVPYGRAHTNPPVTADAPWPEPVARRLAVAACYDCHSNQTEWPLYSWVAPSSWLVTGDIEAGRDKLNFSNWDRDTEADKAAEAVADRSMPPSRYTLLHPGARLSDEERRQLVAALEAMDRLRDEDGGGGDR